MKRVTKNKTGKGKITIDNLLKEGFTHTKKYVIYRRVSPNGHEQYAFLRKRSTTEAGWISLIGGSHYGPAYVRDTYSESIRAAHAERKLFQFKNLQEFLDLKDDIKWFKK